MMVIVFGGGGGRVFVWEGADLFSFTFLPKLLEKFGY